MPVPGAGSDRSGGKAKLEPVGTLLAWGTALLLFNRPDEQPASNSSEEAGDAEAGDTVEQGDPEPVADEDDPDAGDETLTDFFAVEEGERPDDGEPGVQLPAVGGGDVLPPAVEKPATGRRKK